MSKEHFQNLDQSQMEYLTKHCEVINIPFEYDIIYENQIPSTSFILVEGEVDLYKSRRKIKTAFSGAIIGLKNLINNDPVKNTYRIRGPAKIISFNRTALFEIVKNEADTLHRLVSGILHFGK